MKACLTRVLAGTFAVAASSLLGCSSDSSPPATGTGGSTGGAVTASGGASTGGTTTNPIPTGGSLPSGGTPASGGQTQVQGGSIAQGGVATGGAATSTGGQPATGGRASGGAASGGSVTGGSATGGSVAGGSLTGVSLTGGSVAGGSATGGGVTGGTTTGGVSTGGAATGGRTTTGGTASGGTETGGVTATGGTTAIGGSSGKITVWMAGDSTMSGSGCDGGGWGTQFAAVFNSNVTVQNKSVAGRSIQTWLYEGAVSSTTGSNGECTLTGTTYSANWKDMLTGMKAGDYLFVQFGINDGSACPRHVGTALFQTYLTTMAKAASDRGAQAIFLSPTNAIMCTGSTAQANTRGTYPAATKAATTTANVPFIDVTTLSADLYTSEGLCPNSADYSSTTSKVGIFFCNDHTHFSADGALKIAKMVGKALKDQGIALAAYLL